MGTSALGSLPAIDIAWEFDVFVNYHVSDRDAVTRVAERLRSRGIRVWFDLWSIPKGGLWMSEMAKGIRTSRATAAFIGPGIKGYWQEQEYQYALTNKTPQTRPVIPVLLPSTSQADIPDFLGLRNAVDFSSGLDNEREFEGLLEAIRPKDGTPRVVATPRPDAMALPDDVAGPISDLTGSLRSNNITFFIGSETAAAASPPASRDCDIAFRLLSEIKVISEPGVILPPADVAALYYAVTRRDGGLELAVAELLQNRSAAWPSLHYRLARILPLLMGYARPRGRKPSRQLIISTSLDTLMERALVQNRIKFVRIVACRDRPMFQVNDYRKARFESDNREFGLNNAEYNLSSQEGIDDFIRSFGEREARAQEAVEYLGSDELLTPLVLKLRGSYDVAGSPAISTTHLLEIARSLSLEKGFLDTISGIVKSTPAVFFGMGVLGPEFRLCVQALLRGELRSDQPRYLFQMRPDPASDDCFQRLEARIWPEMKARASERGVAIVERSGEEALDWLARAVESPRA